MSNILGAERKHMQSRFAALIIGEGLTQAEAAEICDISRKTACKWYKELKLKAKVAKAKERGFKRDKESANAFVIYIKKHFPENYLLIETMFTHYTKPRLKT